MIKKIYFVLAVLLMSSIGAEAQLLYRISGNGLEKPSFIVGTHHLADATFAEKIPGVKEALQQIEQVYGEVNMAEMYSKDTLAIVTSAAYLPEGQTLKTVLSADQLAKVDVFCTEVLGQPLTNQIIFAAMGRLSPTSLVNQFQILMFLKKHPQDFNPTKPFDKYFQDYALSAGKQVGGFEYVSDQMKMLYGTPMSRQIEQLMCMAENKAYYENQIEELTQAFYAMDVDKVEKSFFEKLNSRCDATPEEEDILIYNRNRNWCQQMPAIMKAKPTFFAVGTGHLFGDKGVINLLRQAGYTIEAIK